MKSAGTFRRRFGKMVLTILATLLVGWVTYKLSNWVFTIRAIEIVGQNAQVQIDEDRISRNLLFFPSDILRQQVLDENPWLADVRFEKKFPGTLRIVPSLRTPVAILQSHDRVVLVDREGVVVADGDSGNRLPVLVVPLEPFRVGETLDDSRVRLALRLITQMAPDLTFTRITYENDSYLRAKTVKLDIIIAQDRPISETLATLQMLLTGFRIKGTLPTVVDLRFDKPIVTF